MTYTSVLKRVLSFGDAMNALKEGKKITRSVWGGYWFLSNKPQVAEMLEDGYVKGFDLHPTIFAVLKGMGGVAPAQPYQGDMLANDWMIVE
ncbi:Thoeris anti-defense Tad2 family protein [Bacillus thuringiensis]|uniref:Thoeris anti-defense Tad2 family protein n=1 Tax=Bacillus thuringiensis TaxID=1428 RepID=UPI0011A3A358|nr:MW1434 family type I TA system toxin [Bacillus thuringiensis]